MKIKWSLWSGCLGIVFLLASCGSTAHVEKDDTVDFSRYKTYAWIDKDGRGPRNHNRRNDLTESKVKDAVNEMLGKTAGWSEVRSRPDVLLTYDVLVEKTTKQQSDPVYSQPFRRIYYNPWRRSYMTVYYPSQFLGYDRDQYQVREGTVTITMIDARTDKTVWQGWTTDEVDSRNMTDKEISSAVKSIFRKFDVGRK